MPGKILLASSAALVALALSPLGACSPEIHDGGGGAGGASSATDPTTTVTSTPTAEGGAGTTTTTETTTETTTTTTTTTDTTTTTTTTTTANPCGGLAMQLAGPCQDCAVANCCSDLAACDTGTQCYKLFTCIAQGVQTKQQCEAMFPVGIMADEVLSHCLDTLCPGICGMN